MTVIIEKRIKSHKKIIQMSIKLDPSWSLRKFILFCRFFDLFRSTSWRIFTCWVEKRLLAETMLRLSVKTMLVSTESKLLLTSEATLIVWIKSYSILSSIKMAMTVITAKRRTSKLIIAKLLLRIKTLTAKISTRMSSIRPTKNSSRPSWTNQNSILWWWMRSLISSTEI